MPTFKTSRGDLRVDTESIEITMGGWLGDPSDCIRRFAPGARYYHLNGEPISQAEAEAILNADMKPVKP